MTSSHSEGSNYPGCSSGRTIVYKMVCDTTAPAGSSSAPDKLLVVQEACTYEVTWRTAAACAVLVPSSSCPAATKPIPTPTSPQLRYQTGEIVALTHFNMASFVQNGDPGCTADNWLTKAPYAVGLVTPPRPAQINLSTITIATTSTPTTVAAATLWYHVVLCFGAVWHRLLNSAHPLCI